MSADDDLGGDPVCWLDRVCPDCGAFRDDVDAPCPRCGHDAEDGPDPVAASPA